MDLPQRNFNVFGSKMYVPKEIYPNMDVTDWWEQTREDCPIVWRGHQVKCLAFEIGLHSAWNPFDIYNDALNQMNTYLRTGKCRIHVIGDRGLVDTWYLDRITGNKIYRLLFDCVNADEFVTKAQQILSTVKI